LCVAACGYSTSSHTAKDIKSVAVPFFSNLTTEPNLEISVTEMIIDNLVSDNTLKVMNEDNADAILEGDIVTFTNTPFSFNQDLNAEEYRVVLIVKVKLYNRRLNEAIWQDQRITGDGAYFVDASESGLTYEDALEEAIKEITEQILNLTVQDW
ncbi:MAG: LptE family protein, partial [Candidatus Latescibacterota bacterium]